METRMALTINIEDGTIMGEATFYVSKWDGPHLKWNARVYEDTALVTSIESDQSVYPYAIAALRDAADRAIAAMVEKFSRGEVLLMHEVNIDQISLRVAAGAA